MQMGYPLPMQPHNPRIPTSSGIPSNPFVVASPCAHLYVFVYGDKANPMIGLGQWCRCKSDLKPCTQGVKRRALRSTRCLLNITHAPKQVTVAENFSNGEAQRVIVEVPSCSLDWASLIDEAPSPNAHPKRVTRAPQRLTRQAQRAKREVPSLNAEPLNVNAVLPGMAHARNIAERHPFSAAAQCRLVNGRPQ